ncbi:hypothetical protein [Desulfosporosinus sp. BG]|uniref:hypothetical protein n=1 Tax=Desulfosporosinus sp. BG TaxID=1633135 RepID=UPI00083ADF2B|nr:hypothetical protein [Desulfosporosinus sp. BG]ODA43105.1 hypothetical protein DSBG_0101 [Desulfosporosinus sp. BG]
MDFEQVQHNFRQNGLGKKVAKVVLTGCLFLVIVFVILLVIAVILAFKYNAQIYDGFVRIINYIFGNSPENLISGYFKQFADNFLKNLFN